MALDAADLEKLAQFIDSKISVVKSDLESVFGQQNAPAAAPAAETDRTAVVGKPDVNPEAGPEYYVHLADGEVIVSRDSASTHIAGSDGTPVAVIGRYQKGA